MSYSLTPSKRPYDKSPREANGKGKWAKIQNQPLKISSGSTIFRLLCPVSKIGSVIGKAGNVISNIRQDTGAKVKVEDLVPGCDERVIVIAASDKETEVTTNKSKDDSEETNAAEEGDGTTEHCEKDNDKEPDTVEALKPEKETSSILMALLLIFERMVEGETETDKGDEESDKSSAFVARLLVLSSQVGCLLGKDGGVIKHMSSESGAHICILPRNKLPPCVSASDELVQITGGSEAVRKALHSVSQQLLENPPRDHDSFPANSTGPSSNYFGIPFFGPEELQSSEHSLHAQGVPFADGPRDAADHTSTVPQLVSKYHESGRMNQSEDIITFRLLCHEDNVGGVIGKGGTIVKTLQHETGCEIKVLERVPDSDDRLIVISGAVHPDDRISAPQDAVLRVQTRIVRAAPDIMEKTVIAKILVSANQIGCLLGKGGSIITEMRKSSGAYIRILGKDQIPKCVPENEEVVQINGEFEAVQEALFQISARLQQHFFRDTFTSVNHPSHPSFQDQVPPFPSYMGRRELELSSPGMYSNLGPSYHKFDAGGGLHPHGGFHPHDDRSPFMHNIHRPGFPFHLSGRNSSSAPWGSQELVDVGGPDGFSDYAGAPQRRIAGFGGGRHSPIITNTKMEVIVPRSVVPSIYGEDGGCLKQIRQISDAKITITEPKPGATETVIIISGTPEQAHAAQSLIQAFVMSEAKSS